MARHRRHPAVIAARAVAEDRRQAAHRPGARVPDVIRRVDMTEEHEPWWGLGNPLPEGRTTHELHLVVVIVGRVEDAIRWTVGDEHVETIRDLIPETVDRATILHVGPVPVPRTERRSPESETLDGLLLVDEEVDLPVLDQVTGDETLVKASVMVPGHEDLHRDRQRGEPVDECPELGLVPVGIEVVRRVT